MKSKFIALLVILSSSISFGQEEDLEWKDLSSDEFSIQLPTNWALDQSGQMGTSFFAFSPLSSEEDKFRDNFNLIIQDLKGLNVDFETFVNISKEQVKTLINDSKLITDERITDDLLQYHKLIYTGKQGIFSLKFHQHCWVVNDRAYILTFTSEENQYDNFVSITTKVMNSFKLFEN